MSDLIKTYFCYISGEEIDQPRAEALLELGVPENLMTSKKVAEKTITRKKGVYFGEQGSGELVVCRKVYDDSVRSVFRNAEAEVTDEDNDEEAKS